MSLTGKIAIVTGGASGIGEAIASGLRDAGARTFIADRRITEEDSFALDVSDPDAVATMAADVRARAGKVDILINSAGVYGAQPWPKLVARDYRRIFDINVLGVALTTQAFAAVMAETGGGSIVNIASAAGRRGNPNSPLYGASKAAVISLTQSAALAYATKGIRVNAIAPGRVDTPMWSEVVAERALLSGMTISEQRETMAQGIPLGRMATAEDVVGAALFLAGDASAYMTGQTLNIDGGLQFG